MYCNTHSTIFTAVRCSHLRKKVLRMDATSYRSSDRTVQHLCLWLQNEHEWKFCEEFAPHPGGTNDNDAHACEPNYITVQNKIIAKILPVNKFTTLKFLSLLPSMNEYFFLIIMFCSAIHFYTDRFTDTDIIVIRPPWLRCEFLAELPLVLIL